MESFDDFESFSPTEAPSSPVPERRLKRLKKAKTLDDNSSKFETIDTGKSNIQDSEEPNLETLDLEKSSSQDEEEPDSGVRSGSVRFEDENGFDSGVGGLRIEEGMSGAKRTLDFDSLAEEFDERGEDRRDDVGMEKENDDVRVEESEKKRCGSDGYERGEDRRDDVEMEKENDDVRVEESEKKRRGSDGYERGEDRRDDVEIEKENDDVRVEESEKKRRGSDGYERCEDRRDDVEIEKENDDVRVEESEKKRRGSGGYERCEDRRDDVEIEKENDDVRVEESEKKRRGSDGFEEKKGKKRVKRVSDDDKFESTVLPKRRTVKERREQLTNLRSESQRLLRETRDVAFKSVPLVQKPISSVLERIRQRKLEVSKKLVKRNTASFIDEYDDGDDDDYDDISHEFGVNVESKHAPDKDGGDDKATNVASEDAISCPANAESGLGGLSADASNNTVNPLSHESICTQMAVDEEPKQAFRAPIDDTQDLFSGSQTSTSQDDLLDNTPKSPLEDVLAPSLLAMNLKLGSAPPDDVSDDEEDNDKENIDPHLQESVDLSSSPNGDPVRAFVDEEAEEEDDSDNDLLRFHDSEEDEDIEDAEELKDMIATQYEENPIDTERRNELHQKWLEQQDVAGTEKLLQRFKCGSKQMDTTMVDEEEDEESEEDNEEFSDEALEDLAPTNVIRMNLRKVKEMIPRMFTDKDDAYISSDDEETEARLVKQCLFEKSEKKATFLSPAEDKDSREVFSLIKKLNIVPNTRKKPKTSALSDMRLIGGNGTVSSKSSFLGRESNHSLPLHQKRGSSMVRSFIFERGDSHSKSALSVSEGSSDAIQRENRPTKTASTKLYSSQVRPSAQNTKAPAETNSGTALIEILRHSSLQSRRTNEDRVVSHTESILATFKLEKPMKKEPNISIRTL